MKKLISVLVVVCILFQSQKVSAQANRDELSVEYSTLTVPQGVYIFGGVLGAAFSLGHFTFDNTIMTGALTVDYMHYFINWFGLGVCAFGEYMTADAYSVDGEGNRTPNGKFNMGFASVNPQVKFKYLDNPTWNLYSKLNAGVGVSLTDSPSIIPSFQVSLIGVGFGSPKLKGFVELGFGMQGIVGFGLTFGL